MMRKFLSVVVAFSILTIPFKAKAQDFSDYQLSADELGVVCGFKPIYYVRLKVNANIRKEPDFCRSSIVKVGRAGEIYPVERIIHSNGTIWYQIGKNLYVHYSVVEQVKWL